MPPTNKADSKPADQTAETDETVPAGNTPETPETPAPESKPAFDPATLDEFGQQFVARTSAQVEKANAVTAEIKANSTDKDEILQGVHTALKNAVIPEGLSDERITPEMLAEYDAIVKREVELDMVFRTVAAEYAERKSTEGTDAEKLATLTAERDALEKKIRQARNLLSTEYPGAETLLPEMIRLSGKSGGGSGKGAGGRKLRGFTVDVDGKTAYLGKDNDKKSSFAAAASVLGIPTGELQKSYFETTGTDDVEKLPTTPVTFTVKGSDDKEHTVTATKNA